MDEQAPSITVARAGTADVAILAPLAARTFIEAFGDDNAPEDIEAYIRASFSLERLAAQLAEADSYFFLASTMAEPLGYAHLRFGRTPPGVPGQQPIELARIYVGAGWHGGGVGAALLQRGIDEGRAAGADAMWLGVWERNERALAFYRKWGFTRVGEQRFMLGSDAQTDHVMARLL